MGLLIDGLWHDRGYDTKSTGGRFQRWESHFRNWITADGSPGPSGEGGFAAEPGRYHLYIAHACPWAHRTLIFRKLKGLEDVISFSPVEPDMLENGWEFGAAGEETEDPIHGYRCLHQLYTHCESQYSGRVTTPTLYDKERDTIVSNESAEIIRMLGSAFDAYTDVKTDYYPPELRADIDAINEKVYHHVNNGVYKTGFATTQQAYEEAFDALFATLDELEALLARQRYLVAERETEADWRLFTTLVRFDAVYVGHFKCNLRRIADYPNLSGYLRELYQRPGIAETVRFDHIKRHYYYSHRSINPYGIVAKGPELDLESPHGREELPGTPVSVG